MTAFSRRGCVFAGLFALAAALFAGSASADRITLNDGTVLYGTVIPQGAQYWVKAEDGKTQKIDKTSVAKVEKGITSATDGASKPAAPATGTPPTAPPSTTGVKKPPVTLSVALARSNAVTKPMQAVVIWQEFLDTKPAGDELKTATAEMAKWKALTEGEAEKIAGKWVGGPERKALLEKADTLNKAGWEMMKNNQTLQAMKKFEEAVAVYPNSFRANFFLGYINILQEKAPEAQKYFDAALKLQPDSPETLSNLGLLAFNKKQYAAAIKMMHKAAEGRDSKPIALNLCFAISMSPPNIRKSNALKPATDAARLLGAKYGIPENVNSYMFVGLHEDELKKPDAMDTLAGVLSSGTGFIIDDTGLILTNRHVVDKGKSFMIMLGDGTQRSAEVVVMDETQDLALVRLKNDDKKKFPTVQLSQNDAPGDGAECTVMGFPLIDRMGASIKITRGIVSSAAARTIGPDVVIDAKVNPGNSGGPILDKHGHVMAIVSMKSIATAIEDSYGLGISAGNVRKFLTKNNVTQTAGQPGPAPLSAEEIAAKVKPATVCILSTM